LFRFSLDFFFAVLIKVKESWGKRERAGENWGQVGKFWETDKCAFRCDARPGLNGLGAYFDLLGASRTIYFRICFASQGILHF